MPVDMRGATAIVGVGETEVGRVPHLSCSQLYAKAIKLAVENAGLKLSDVDGLVTGNSRHEDYLYHAEMMAEYLQIEPTYCLTVNTGGSTTTTIMSHVAAALHSGLARNVVIVMADNLLTGMGRSATIESMATIGHPQFEAPYGPLIPSLYALLGQRYMHDFSIAPEDVAVVPVVQRYHASLGTAAQYREPITVEDVLNSRMIATPLHLLECAPVSDAGCAIVMTTAERARDVSVKPVYLLGMGESHKFEHVSQAHSLSTSGALESGRAAFRMSGFGPGDMDLAMIYDAFGFIVCMQLEDLGFCNKGEGAHFVTSGKTRLGGQLPVNTHGGLLSHSHAGRPSTLFSVIEAVKQLRGECGVRQVAGAMRALVHGEGGILASHSTVILGKEV